MVESKTFKQVDASFDWIQAIEHEVQAVVCNNTWTLVDPSTNTNIFSYRWVYKIKKWMVQLKERKHDCYVAWVFSQVQR